MMKLVVPMSDRPRCIVDGCDRAAQNTRRNAEGVMQFRKYCQKHHIERRQAFSILRLENNNRRKFPKCAVVGCNKHTSLFGSDESGSPVYTKNCQDHANVSSVYLPFRKSYCENIDGRLGFSCTTTILLPAQLEVDHIDGNPYNNTPSNLQTLCGCCHKYKTIVNKDYATPGRKSLKKAA